MALSTVLLLATGMGVNLGFQDPAMDMQFAIPVLDQSTAAPATTNYFQSQIPVVQGQAVEAPPVAQLYEVVARTQEAQGPKVSVNFTKAPVMDVFNWLKDKGVNFVIADGMIPAGTTVTLNINDQPVDAVVEAVAAAIGGHWQRQGAVRVYRAGPSPFMAAQGMPGNFTAFAPGTAAKAWDNKDLAKSFGPEFHKKMELMSKDVAAKFGSQHQKEMQKQFGPDFEKKMAKMAEEHATMMSKEFGPDFQKKMEKMGAEHEAMMKKQFGPEFEVKMKKMAEEMEVRGRKMEVQGREMEVRARTFEKANKELMEKARKEGRVYEVKDGVVYQLKDGKAVKVEGLKEGVIAPRIRIEGGRATATAPGTRTRVLRSGQAREVEVFARSGRGGTFNVDAEKFIKSLTADQKFQMRTRGFLYYIDLTKEQKAMLGAKPDGRFELKFNVNGQEAVVKGS
ncbi:MAG TPA: hypothetical protein VK934_05790 [Fimbriimonas sp.]|nr:hypothetical protein [Fimbriimonas sp.]